MKRFNPNITDEHKSCHQEFHKASMVPRDYEKWLEKDYEEVGIEIAEADEDGCEDEEY